jgi:hypothetical protein
MNKRSNYPAMSLIIGLMCLGLSIIPTPIWVRIILSFVGFAGLIIGILGIKRMK